MNRHFFGLIGLEFNPKCRARPVLSNHLPMQGPMNSPSIYGACHRATPLFHKNPVAKLTGIALLCAQMGVFAQDAGVGGQSETSSNAQPSAIQSVEIVARQGSTELRRAASVAKQIYGREELDRYGDTNALDVMRRLPGVNVDSGGPRMRGLGAGYTQILINGDPAPQGFNLDQLSPSQIERIEVIRAPTADQSAQAVAGSINIILKETSRRAQSNLRIGVAKGYERPVANLNYSISESNGPLSMSLPVSIFEWNRQIKTATERQMPGMDGQSATSEQLASALSHGWGYNVSPRLNYKFSDEQTLAIATFFQKGFWNYRTDNVNRALNGSPVFDDDTIQNGYWENRRGNLTWINRFSEDQRIEIKLGLQQSRSTYDARNILTNSVYLRSVGGNEEQSVTQSGKYSHLLGTEHTLTAGWDLESKNRTERRSTTDSAGNALLPAFEGQAFEAQVRRQAIYIQDEWEISPQWQLYLGLRNERIASESENVSYPVSNASSVLSPLAHVTYKFDPKSRDMVRASLTRSYKAPGLNALLARPQINGGFTNISLTNTALSPDRIGNPNLVPELATGLDIAYENYLTNEGIFSVGVFQRNLTNVVRNVTSLRSVDWASAPRWVTEPQNFSDAVTRGIEFELRGRASELMPQLLSHAKALNLRASLSIYHSNLKALAGPDNRLDGQQPWSTNLGFDQRISGLPLNVGGNFSYTPSYDTRQTTEQLFKRSKARSIDVFAMMFLSPTVSLRAAARAGTQQFGPPNLTTLTMLSNGDYSRVSRYEKPQLNLTMDIRL